MFEIFKFRNKKAALQLSINAIVIVVLAMTLLGLGLGFIRTMFKEITGTYLKLAKLAGISFFVGTAIIVIGFILR